MFNLLISILFLLCPADSIPPSSEAEGGFARMTFTSEQTYDFGKVSLKHKSKYKHTFLFSNTGTKDLRILHAATGCGCTTPTYTKDAIAPGKNGKVVVQFNPRGQHQGPFRKSVTIYSNDPRSYTRLFITGIITE